MRSLAFYVALSMNIAACVMFAVLFLVRLIRPIPRRYVFVFWAVVALRLMLPFAPAGSLSLLGLSGGLVRRAVPLGWFSVTNSVGLAQEVFPLTFASDAVGAAFAVGSAVWLIVAGLAVLCVGIAYILSLRRLRSAVPLREELYVSPLVSSPVLVGVFRPKIILPQGFDPDGPEGAPVLSHERAHKRRRDNLWRLVAILLCCVHWFNPLAWLMLRLFFRDMELSCDERALRGQDPAARVRYAETLLQFSAGPEVFPASAFGGGETALRVKQALSYKRVSLCGAIISIVFLLGLAVFCLTNPPA